MLGILIHEVVLLVSKKEVTSCGVTVKHETQCHIHRVSKNVTLLACHEFDTCEWILIFFGRNVTDNVSNQKMLYCATSSNLCFCTTLHNGEQENCIFTQMLY